MKALPTQMILLVIFSLTIVACKKVDQVIPETKEMLTHNLTVENIMAPGGTVSITNKSFINLHD